jgi:hypothetical protein
LSNLIIYKSELCVFVFNNHKFIFHNNANLSKSALFFNNNNNTIIYSTDHSVDDVIILSEPTGQHQQDRNDSVNRVDKDKSLPIQSKRRRSSSGLSQKKNCKRKLIDTSCAAQMSPKSLTESSAREHIIYSIDDYVDDTSVIFIKETLHSRGDLSECDVTDITDREMSYGMAIC